MPIKLTDEQIDLAWAYAYRFFFNFPLPYPWHLVRLWEDYENNDISSMFHSKEWPQFEKVFPLSGWVNRLTGQRMETENHA